MMKKRIIYFIFFALLLFFIFLFFFSFNYQKNLSPEDGVPLALNEVFVKNTNTFPYYGLASVPITFPRGYSSSRVSQLCLIDTRNNNHVLSQVQPTSYYSDGNVRTAVLHLIPSKTVYSTPNSPISSNEEVIYRIAETGCISPPAFQMHFSVNQILESGEISATSRDLESPSATGRPEGYYKARVPALSTISSNPDFKLIVDGPVLRIYEYTAANRPTQAGTIFTHLGSSKFYIRVVSGEPLVGISHLWVNANYLKDMLPGRTAPTSTNPHYTYSDPQLGHAKYHSLVMNINAASSNPVEYRLTDHELVFPTIATYGNGWASVDIMPYEGQTMLGWAYQDFCSNNGVLDLTTYECSTGELYIQGGYRQGTESNPTHIDNWIGAGQGLTTEGVIYLEPSNINGGNLPAQTAGHSYDYFERNGLDTGQSYERYSQVDDVLYSEIPNPDYFGSTISSSGKHFWDFDSFALGQLYGTLGGPPYPHYVFWYWGETTEGSYKTRLDDPYRFSSAGFGRRVMSQSGDGLSLNTIQTPYVKYILSCGAGDNRCNKEYLETLRYWSLDTPNVGMFIFGFESVNHPESWTACSMYVRYFPTIGYDPSNGAYNSGNENGVQCTEATDHLGFCNQGVIRDDATYGRYFVNYPGVGVTRGWTCWDDSHLGTNMIANYYETSGNPLYLEFVEQTAGKFANHFTFRENHNLGVSSGRAMGRSVIAVAELYRMTQRNDLLAVIERMVDNYVPAPRTSPVQTHPITGDEIPYGYLQSYGAYSKVDGCHQSECGVVWEEGIMSEAFAHIYKLTSNPAVKLNIETLWNSQLNYYFNFAYKKPNQVRNGIPIAHPIYTNLALNEGPGFFANWVSVINDGLPLNQWIEHTQYRLWVGSFFEVMESGICDAIKYNQNIDANLREEYRQKFKEAFKAHYLFNFDNYGIRMVRNGGLNVFVLSGYSMCGLSYGLGIPVGTVTQTAELSDLDNDGFSSIMGDCDDSNSAINPNARETCDDGLDNNCNTLFDCNDMQCNTNAACSLGYCGDNLVQTNLGEECDVKDYGKTTAPVLSNLNAPLTISYTALGPNSCPAGTCAPAYTYAGGTNCKCSSQPICGDGVVTASIGEQCDPPIVERCGPNSCNSCMCNGPILEGINPNNIQASTGAITLNGENFVSSSWQIKIDGIIQNIHVVKNGNSELQIDSSSVYSLGVGSYMLSVYDSINSKDSRSLPINILSGDCSSYTSSFTCSTHSTICQWCEDCAGPKYSGGPDRCVPLGTCAYSCSAGSICVANSCSTGTCSSGQTCNLETCQCELSQQSNPVISSINPNTITNNILTPVSIIGSDFNPIELLANGLVIPRELWIFSNSGLINLDVIPGIVPGDYSISLKNADNSLSNSRTIRVNYPFNYLMTLSSSSVVMDPVSTFDLNVNLQSLDFMTHENVVLSLQSSPGISAAFANGNSCKPSTRCSLNIVIASENIVTNTPYYVDVTGTSALTSVSHTERFSIIATGSEYCGNGICNSAFEETCSTCSEDCGTCTTSSTSSSSSSSSSGGPRPAATQCNDKKDNDGDGKIDYPIDSGCDSKVDNNELNINDIVTPGNKTLGDNKTDIPGDNIDGDDKQENNVGIVFWIISIILIVGIIIVSILLLRNIKKSSTFNKIAIKNQILNK